MTNPNLVTDRHLIGFGAITHQYARFERLIEAVVSRVLDKNLGVIGLLMSGLGYRAKVDVLESLLKIFIPPQNVKEPLEKCLVGFEANTGLRNSIAHHEWVPGARPDSIRPLSISARSGKARVRGLEDDELDYTPEEMIAIANELKALLAAFPRA